MKSIGKQRSVWVFLLSVLTVLCVTLASVLLPAKTAAADDANAYKYLLEFEDDFDDGISDDWAYVLGGSSYSYPDGGNTVRGWRFNGENHIAYKNSTAGDYGKFLYGTETSTNYVFEVKMRADVTETVGEFVDAHTVDGKLSVTASDLTINTNIPFFVTNPKPDSNTHTFRGRSVCISNYAIGFYEVGVNAEDGSSNSGWVKVSDTANATVRLKTLFSGDFDWRDWHTIRVEATETECRLWLDGVLALTVAQELFTRSTATSGYCGFIGSCGLNFAPLHFDDFKYWETNENYDSTAKVEATVSSIDAADFRDNTKVVYTSSDFTGGLEETTENKILYNTDAKFGGDLRVLKDYNYTSFQTALAFDIERQKADKGVAADGTYSGSTDVRTSDLSGVLFNGSFGSDNKYNGYLLNYWASYYKGGSTNTVTLALRKLVSNAQSGNVIIGTLSGTTSCVVDMKVEGGYLELSVYKTKEDYENGTKAALTDSASSVTVTDGVYKVALPTYDAAAGGDYTEGYFGFRCNSGGTNLKLVYDAEILNFSGKAVLIPDITQPAEEVTDKTLTVSADANGTVAVDGKDAVASQTVKAHSDVKLSFTPAAGYVVDSVKINGVAVGAVTEYTVANVTQDYSVEVTFTNKNVVDVYILAGQSNAAGFTPTESLYKAYTYGGTLNTDKIAEYEAGYTDIMYYGITTTADPASSSARWDYVKIGKGNDAAKIGPELGFAEVMSQYYGGDNGKAAVVKYAVGSTGFQYRAHNRVKTNGNWYSPTAQARFLANGGEFAVPETVGLMYTNLLITIRQAMESMIAQGYEPNIKGMFWMQGCEDASYEDLANAYQDNLTDLINDVRADVTKIMTELEYPQDCSKMPFVIGKIGADLEKADYEGVVREKMDKVAETVENVRTVDSNGYILPDPNDNNDRWHFSGKGCLGMGNRFAEALADMTGLNNDEPSSGGDVPSGGDTPSGDDTPSGGDTSSDGNTDSDSSSNAGTSSDDGSSSQGIGSLLGGCFGSASLGGLALVVALGGAMLAKKRKNN